MQQAHGGTSGAGLPVHAAVQHIELREDKPEIPMTRILSLFPRRLNRHDAELAYLNAAVSLYDLECREREIDQGKFAHF